MTDNLQMLRNAAGGVPFSTNEMHNAADELAKLRDEVLELRGNAFKRHAQRLDQLEEALNGLAKIVNSWPGTDKIREISADVYHEQSPTHRIAVLEVALKATQADLGTSNEIRRGLEERLERLEGKSGTFHPEAHIRAVARDEQSGFKIRLERLEAWRQKLGDVFDNER